MEIKEENTIPECIEKIEKCNFECVAGNIKNNGSFIKLKELAKNLTTPSFIEKIEQRDDVDKHNRYISIEGFAYCPDCGTEFW